MKFIMQRYNDPKYTANTTKDVPTEENVNSFRLGKVKQQALTQ